MANPTITELQTMFRNFAGDSSISTANIEYYLKNPYNDFAKDIRDTNIKGLVPLVISKLSVTVDDDKGPYVTLPNDTVVWRLFKNQQTGFVNDGTNYKIYMVNSPTTQLTEYVPAQTLPSGVNEAVYSNDVCKIIVMKGVIDYHSDNKQFEEEARLQKKMEEKMAGLRAGFKQEYIYTSNDDNYAEIQVNI